MPESKYFDCVNSGNFLPRIYRYDPKPLSKVYHPAYGSKLRTARHDPKKGLYPMDYDLDCVKNLVTGIRDYDKYRQTKANSDIKEFQTLKQYGKDMFDHALSDARQNPACRRRSAPPTFTEVEPQQQKQRARPKTTGPTRLGSPIYNKRAELLNKIRTQTRICFPDSKLTNQQHLQQTIDMYNKQYLLVAEDSSEQVCATNATFMSKAEFTRQQNLEVAVQPFNTPKIVLEKTTKHSPEEQDSGEEATRLIEYVESAPAVMVIDAESSTSPIADPLSLPEVSVSSHYDELEKIKKGATRLTPVLQNQSAEVFLKTHSRPSSARKGNEAKINIADQAKMPDPDSDTESARSSRSVHSTDSHVSMRPMVRTWVDDISVSSVGNKSQAGSDVMDSAGATGAEVLPEPPKKVIIEDVNENEPCGPQPPTYICPSSASKSREYAIKLWLTKTDFSRAPRSVPLV